MRKLEVNQSWKTIIFQEKLLPKIGLKEGGSKVTLLANLQNVREVKQFATDKDQRSDFQDMFNTKSAYNWIGCQVDIWDKPAFLLTVTGVKSETSFGFLIENYTRQGVLFFVKLQNISFD